MKSNKPTCTNLNYELPARPHAELPELQAAIPFPPPALLHTALPTVTTVSTAPQLTTVIPPSTKVILPVLPEVSRASSHSHSLRPGRRCR